MDAFNAFFLNEALVIRPVVDLGIISERMSTPELLKPEKNKNFYIWPLKTSLIWETFFTFLISNKVTSKLSKFKDSELYTVKFCYNASIYNGLLAGTPFYLLGPRS